MSAFKSTLEYIITVLYNLLAVYSFANWVKYYHIADVYSESEIFQKQKRV